MLHKAYQRIGFLIGKNFFRESHKSVHISKIHKELMNCHIGERFAPNLSNGWIFFFFASKKPYTNVISANSTRIPQFVIFHEFLKCELAYVTAHICVCVRMCKVVNI